MTNISRYLTTNNYSYLQWFRFNLDEPLSRFKVFRSDNEPKKVMLLHGSYREHCNNFALSCHVT